MRDSLSMRSGRGLYAAGLALILLACASAVPAPRAIPSDEDSLLEVISFLESRVSGDPDDVVALNRLADAYLARLRQTGNHDYIPKALQAADSSLAVLPAKLNAGGLKVRGRARAAGHQFRTALEDAELLIRLEPQQQDGYLLLHDAAFELGNYAAAESALDRARQRGGNGIAMLTRLAKLDLIRGKVASARSSMVSALRLSGTDRDASAWLRWQLGEIAFNAGDLSGAERSFRDSLVIFPGFIHAAAALARVEAARGRLDKSAELYESVIAVDPVPIYVAALADVRFAQGQAEEGERLLQSIERNSDPLDSRQLALIWADHDRRIPAAYELARTDYAHRKDVYGADVLAWSAFKAGRIDEARDAMTAAMQHGTRDARLFFHAGMIAAAEGRTSQSRELLRRALQTNPWFDLRQAAQARRILSSDAAETPLKARP